MGFFVRSIEYVKLLDFVCVLVMANLRLNTV